MNDIIIKQATIKEEIRAVFVIRKEVFVIEQKMFKESDVDQNDLKSTYLIAKNNSKILGTVRVFPLENGAWMGGRLAVRKKYRGAYNGTYIGSMLVKEAVTYVLANNCNNFSALIQEKNVNFFKKIGWKPIGDIVSHLGRPHQSMEANLKNP